MRHDVHAHRHDHETLPRQLFRQVVVPAAARERLPGWTRPDPLVRLRVTTEHLEGALTV
ncbi:hypothetical protein SK803_35035 [Lentzea sp. BCCO 10_0856]|uniref:Uncharacterized protein n=1 Tax=Lentzea miocenica TaxID=3095431 RepID=A0ABU4TBC9_9PSEU|nr:hypothetical protein [Lentzea sp. BCCO 10_0856]MDX8035451.1 hypothetical protein [Lentzea sp. BCCO 10_0856]